MKTQPYAPSVTREEVYSYDAHRPETRTASPIVNAVLAAFQELGLVSCQAVARHLCLDAVKLSGAIAVETGMGMADFRKLVEDCAIQRCRREHPEWSCEEIARELGLFNRSVVLRRVKEDKVELAPRSIKRTPAGQPSRPHN